ncbi:hypothetical protein [Candidatus Poriferisocius sp.]|uniref:hypothetical protein n=1 Tax=Candidatus Poriferisocius sp. TaxID=3101276 RepID=UPI003B5CA77B
MCAPIDADATEAMRQQRREAMLGLIASWEAEEGPIDQEHLEWADAVLDRQGVARQVG